MRKRSGLLALVLFAAGGVPASAHAQTAIIDWFVGIVTAKANVRVELNFDWRITRTAPGPIMNTFGEFITGLPVSSDYDFIDAFTIEGDGGAVTTSKDAGGRRVNLPANLARTLELRWDVVGAEGALVMRKGQRWAILASVTNARFDSASWRYFVRGPATSVQIVKHAGRGSRALLAVDPAAAGYGIATPAIAAGKTKQVLRTSTPIVGAVAWQWCSYCEGRWTSPKRTGTWKNADGRFLPNEPEQLAFAGPAGSWSWEWTGATYDGVQGPDVLGAIVPIGNDWVHFASVPPYLWRFSPSIPKAATVGDARA